MRILSEFLNENIVNALGWTIFHILWQGTLIAMFTGFILRIFIRKSSQLRYLIALSSLFIIVGLSVFNFSNNYGNSSITLNQYEITLNEPIKSFNQSIEVFSNVDNKISDSRIITLVLNNIDNLSNYFPFVVSLWFIGVSFFLIRFIFSYLYTSRLRTKGVTAIQKEWLKEFNEIKINLHVKRTVRFLESTLIKVPVVLGYLKPIVLIPAEMLSGIPKNQIEAIIAHELAHIRRNDYIINVIQTIIETVFFFHPAVWYLSSKISNERENCCDDIALTVCDGSLVYAKALVSIQDLSLRRHYAAVAFSGRKKHLLNRIKRMIMKPKGKTNFTDKIIAASIILSAIVALSFTYTAKYPSEMDILDGITDTKQFEKVEKKIPSVPSTPSVPAVHVISHKIVAPEKIIIDDTVKNIHISGDYYDIDNNTITKIVETKNGKKEHMRFTLKNGKATELYVNGEKIPENEYDKYQSEIDEIIDDLEDAKADIRDAIEEVEDIDFEKIHLEIQEAIKNVHIDMEAVQEDLKRAMEDVEMVNIEEIMKDVEANLKDLDELHNFDLNFDINGESFHFDMDELELEEIRKQIEQAKLEMKEQIDMVEIQKEMMKVQEELSKISEEEIRAQVEESAKHFEEFDKQETIKELQKQLEELENLEIEEK